MANLVNILGAPDGVYTIYFVYNMILMAWYIVLFRIATSSLHYVVWFMYYMMCSIQITRSFQVRIHRKIVLVVTMLRQWWIYVCQVDILNDCVALDKALHDITYYLQGIP